MKKIILTLFLLLQTSIILGGKLLNNFLAHAKQDDLSALKAAIVLHQHFLDKKSVLSLQLPQIIKQFKIFEGMEEICKEIEIDIITLQKILTTKQKYLEQMTDLKNNFQQKAREIFKQKISPQELQEQLELLKVTPQGLIPSNPNEITKEEQEDFNMLNSLLGASLPQNVVTKYGPGTMKDIFKRMESSAASTHTKIKKTSHEIKERLSELPMNKLQSQQYNQIKLAEKRAQLQLNRHKKNLQKRQQQVSPKNLAASFTTIIQQTLVGEELAKYGQKGDQEMYNFIKILKQYEKRFGQTSIDLDNILKTIIRKIIDLQRLKTKSAFPIPIPVFTPEEKASEEKIEKEREKQFAEDLITITKGNALLSLNTNEKKSKKVKHQESPPQPRKTEIYYLAPKTITDFFAGENYSITLFDLRLHFHGKEILPEKIPNVIDYTERVNGLFAHKNNPYLVPHLNNGVPTLFDSHNGLLLERTDLFHLFSKLVDPEVFRYGIWEKIKHKDPNSNKFEKQIQVSIFVEISYKGLPPQFGFVQYTFDSDGKCYHRWFQPLQNLKFSPQLKQAARYFLTEFIKHNGQKIPNNYQQCLNALATNNVKL